MSNFTLKIIEKYNETDDTVTIVFKQPGLKKIKYLAGQYLTLIFRINGRRYLRPYSFSSAPEVDQTLAVTVKRIPGGIVSNHIIDQVKVNDVIEVLEPLGDFTLKSNLVLQNTHIVLWGAGSGITPLMSIAKYALHKYDTSHVTLVYGNRNFESVIFNEKIKELQSRYDNFSGLHFYTQATIGMDNPNIIQGRIDPDMVLSIMQCEGELGNTVHYICGPTGLKESVKAALLKLGIDKERIFSEDFEIIRNPLDFEGITTRMVSINHNNNIAAVEVVKGKSILEAGLDAMIELPYACQTGSCLVCKGRVIKGELKTIGISKLPEELESNECLLCCSFPLNDDVEVAVDN
ncbi:ferredoxin--NADP reductase [Mucilaginibacter pocheonensis]|uniref:Ring-1,2-phenylacetyl-CoA epoxidase subunit PaaE n=1 Tax=Mucilaginibacter pocheonensis TaxID=398050 RepID=A0ABU1T745_9SPHI|nr:ferredoxin--NADP reductase [Mucilaginibacter pocheonensis]MDR6941168.1 ring-1,2-phenylacetyl-CoA epoxidase subunit PaaE [Mucilaginibacter pocheonensis]